MMGRYTEFDIVQPYCSTQATGVRPIFEWRLIVRVRVCMEVYVTKVNLVNRR